MLCYKYVELNVIKLYPNVFFIDKHLVKFMPSD